MILWSNILIFTVYYVIVFTIKKIQIQLKKKSKYSNQDFLIKLKEIANDNKYLNFERAKYYGYDPRKITIFYIKKEEYSAYDTFAIYHELGHYLDDLKSKRILFNMSVTCINRLLAIPIYFGISILALAGTQLFVKISYIIFLLEILLFLHRMYFIVKYEKSASKYAIMRLSDYLDEISLKYIRRVSCLSIVSQIIFSAIWLMIIVFMQIIINYK
ncbi:hypothetical protein [Lachnotalea glycerini]|uniref:Peptidase M48 domain-containing protein n=1 Tax=Lachnotalea glycerini TaxID=1763509 RepID=A0A371J4U1_9FIRM|nr:hypothetical protein [Lachnotalea glycerini]RDY27811.1 hypothetical protein CG710_020220 [Lachnotalea glycerini]